MQISRKNEIDSCSRLACGKKVGLLVLYCTFIVQSAGESCGAVFAGQRSSSSACGDVVRTTAQRREATRRQPGVRQPAQGEGSRQQRCIRRARVARKPVRVVVVIARATASQSAAAAAAAASADAAAGRRLAVRRRAARQRRHCSLINSRNDQCLFQSSFLGGGGSPPQKKLTIPPTAAKLCALNLFFRRGQRTRNAPRKLSFNGQ